MSLECLRRPIQVSSAKGILEAISASSLRARLVFRSRALCHSSVKGIRSTQIDYTHRRGDRKQVTCGFMLIKVFAHQVGGKYGATDDKAEPTGLNPDQVRSKIYPVLPTFFRSLHAVVFSSLETLNGTVDTNAVRHFLNIAWLLFVLAVAIAFACAALFRFMIPEFIEGSNSYADLMNLAAAIISIAQRLLIVLLCRRKR